MLGPADSLELPPLGASLSQNEVGWAQKRQDNRAAFLAPVTGRILAVNGQARECPEAAHMDPYDSGWLMIVEPESPKRNMNNLFFGNECFEWLEQETGKLQQLLGDEYGQLAATGGEPISDLYGAIPEIGWDNLVRTFLLTEKA
jgi:glycine cleavage system H lipoate-binding protein